MKASLSVFIPFFNEEKILLDHAGKVLAFLKDLGHPFELFLVDDGSKDRSGQLARSLAKKDRRVKALRFDNGPSRRENLAQAFLKAGKSTVIYMDCDLASDLNAVRELVRGIGEGHDIVIGSRYSGIKADRSLYRLVWSKAYNAVVRLLFRTGVHDHQCGFKAFKRQAIRTLVGKCGYDPTFRRGWFWDAEVLLRARRAGFSILEIPVRWKAGDKSSFHFWREIKTLAYMLGLRMRLGR